MENPKFRYEVISTVEKVEEAIKFYLAVSEKGNPFLSALNIDSEVIYQETIKEKIPLIAEQSLSGAIYDCETNEIVCTIVSMDYASEYESEIKTKFLKARSSLLSGALKKLFSSSKIEFGQVVHNIFIATKPEYMKISLFRYLDYFLLKYHLKRGYKIRCGELTGPATHHIIRSLGVPFVSVKTIYDEFEYEGERIFKNLDFGKGYENEKPSVLSFYCQIQDYIDGLERWMNKSKAIRSKL